MVPETEEDKGVPETQSSQRVLRKLSQRSLLKKRSEKAKETEAEMVPETEEDVAESQGSQSLLRKRKKSKRIVLKKLGHRIPGAGHTSGDPCNLVDDPVDRYWEDIEALDIAALVKLALRGHLDFPFRSFAIASYYFLVVSNLFDEHMQANST
ncbi:hypothetical protein LXL04_024308 [Taraxacum kok-saghyz]